MRFSEENVHQLISDWRHLYDRNLRGVEGDDAALVHKVHAAFLQCSHFQSTEKERQSVILEIIVDVKDRYLRNAYHSFFHATHVVLSAALLRRSLLQPLAPAEHFALLYAALIHDIGHEGVFNSALVAEGHANAVAYNEVSCAENHSLFTGLAILKRHREQLGFSEAEHCVVRRAVIELVLNTDLADPWRTRLFRLKLADHTAASSLGAGAIDMDTAQGRLLASTLLLKLSDVSSLLQSFGTVEEWAHKFFDEQHCAHDAGRGPPLTNEGFDANQVGFLRGYCADMVSLLEQARVSCIAASLRENVAHSLDEWARTGRSLVAQWDQLKSINTASDTTADTLAPATKRAKV